MTVEQDINRKVQAIKELISKWEPGEGGGSSYAPIDTTQFARKDDIPHNTSELINDSNFVSDSDYVHTDNNFTDAYVAKLNGIEQNAEVNVIETVKINGTALIAQNKTVDVTVPTKLTDLTNDGNFVQDANYVHTENNFTSSYASKLNDIESGAQVNTINTIKVNGITQQIENKAIAITVPTSLSDLSSDSTHRLVTETEKTAWSEKYDKPVGGITIDDLSQSIQNSLVFEKGSGENSVQQITEDNRYLPIASGTYSFAEGYKTQAIGNYASHAEGDTTKAEANTSHAEGEQTWTLGINSHAEGYKSKTGGSNEPDITQKDLNNENGRNAHAEGNTTVAKGNASHSEGTTTLAAGSSSHAEGYNMPIVIEDLVRTRNGAEQDGNKTPKYEILSGHKVTDTYKQGMRLWKYSLNVSDPQDDDWVDIYEENITIKDLSSYNNSVWMPVTKKLGLGDSGRVQALIKVISLGDVSPENIDKVLGARGEGSHIEGLYTSANNDGEHAEGKYNMSNTGNSSEEKTIHSVGIGSILQRKNAFEIMENGDIYIVGIGNYDGTNAGQDGVQTLQQIIASLNS